MSITKYSNSCSSLLYITSLLALSYPLSDAYIPQWVGSVLTPLLACRLFDDQPLYKPMLCFCQWDTLEQTSVKFASNTYLSIRANASANIVCETALILSGGGWVGGGGGGGGGGGAVSSCRDISKIFPRLFSIGTLGTNQLNCIRNSNFFHSRNYIWKYRLQNGGHFVSASVR